MTIDVRHLQMVAAIAASGSVTQAAAAVHLTQSAVSHQLRGLEDRLGTALFLRLGKRMVPTAAGQRILTTAHRVLEEMAAVEADVRGLGTSRAGIVRVCAQCNTGYHWLPPLIQVFQRTYPDVEVAIALEHTARPVQALLDGHLDVAIVTESVRHPRLRIRALFRDEHAAVVRPDHPLAARPFVRPQDFGDERLFLYSSAPDDSFTIQKILRPAGVTPKRVSFVMLTEAILEMVRAGLGISVMQTWAIEPALRDGIVVAVPITRAGIHRQWSAVTVRDAARRPFVDAFIELLATRAIPVRRPALPGRRRASTSAK